MSFVIVTVTQLRLCLFASSQAMCHPDTVNVPMINCYVHCVRQNSFTLLCQLSITFDQHDSALPIANTLHPRAKDLIAGLAPLVLIVTLAMLKVNVLCVN